MTLQVEPKDEYVKMLEAKVEQLEALVKDNGAVSPASPLPDSRYFIMSAWVEKGS